jgi:hypothetical protein
MQISAEISQATKQHVPNRHGGKSKNCFAFNRYVRGADAMAELL